MTVLTREKKHAIVSSLARGRSCAMTAERCHVDVGVVQMLRDNYGPGLPELEAAAHALARPAAAARRLTSADLTPEERAAVTAWAPSVGLYVGRTGAVAQSTLDAWDRAGRPAPTLLAAITAAVATPPTGTHEPIAPAEDAAEPAAEAPREDPRKVRTRERLNDARELLALGETPESIAARLNTTVAALSQAFYRAGDDNYLPFGAATKRQYHKPKEPAMTAPASPTPTGPASFPAILDDLDAHITDVDDPRIVKLHQRALDAVLAYADALDAHRKAAKVNAEIAALEARLAKARDERAKITGTIPGKRGGSASLGPGVAKAVRAWAAANGVDAGTIGRVPGAAVDAWRAAGSPRP